MTAALRLVTSLLLALTLGLATAHTPPARHPAPHPRAARKRLRPIVVNDGAARRGWGRRWDRGGWGGDGRAPVSTRRQDVRPVAQCVDAAPPPAPAGGGAGTYPNEQPFVLPAGYTQTVFAREGDGGTTDNWDMNTLNETGPHAGRFLYRSHETAANGQLSVTDLETGEVLRRHDGGQPRLAEQRVFRRGGRVVDEVAVAPGPHGLPRFRLVVGDAAGARGRHVAAAETCVCQPGVAAELRQLRSHGDGLRHAAVCPAPSHMECPTFRRLLDGAASGAMGKRRTKVARKARSSAWSRR